MRSYEVTHSDKNAFPRPDETPKQEEGLAEWRATAPSVLTDRTFNCEQNAGD